MNKKSIKTYDKQGNLVDEIYVMIDEPLNWDLFNKRFFTDLNYNQIRVVIQQDNSIAQIAAARVESLALKNVETLEVFVECWNQMITLAPEKISNLLSEECIARWNDYATESFMPFTYSTEGLIILFD